MFRSSDTFYFELAVIFMLVIFLHQDLTIGPWIAQAMLHKNSNPERPNTMQIQFFVLYHGIGMF